ncbi:MAG: VWA domain-containing protein [Proteobacteria bacterium]|nr:VWA domain-containing protein [Pseudomonadota bacterium]MDA1355041.1 VWA domain-containing protein [Pseudomonadota bacterium]
MSERKNGLPTEGKQAKSDIDRFLAKVATTPAPVSGQGKGRLLFAMDATASREPSWDHACQIQGEMFDSTAALGGLSVQLIYYRGLSEFRATKWLDNSRALVRHMSAVNCLGGHTQIRKVLKHAIREAKREKLGALVFVGDCMEENVDDLCAMAGELGLLKVPAFMFHEGGETQASLAFRQIARLSGGAYLQFDSHSAAQLKSLLAAVAVYAAGGRRALAKLGKRQGGAALQISHQVK